jgi:hypothetical protein
MDTNNGTGLQLPKIRLTSVIPDSGKGKGRVGGENIYQKLMIEMPAPAQARDSKNKVIKDSPLQFASFFVSSEVPATITDPAEREKAAKDGCAKLINRFTSMSRRIRKDKGETHDYTFRKARDPDVADEKGQWGIIVYRIEPGKRTPAVAPTAGVGAAT